MYTRVVTLSGVKDIDAAVKYLQDTSLSVVRAQKGYKGMTASADRAAGIVGILSLWESEAARAASDSALGKVRDDARAQLGSGLKVELFEERVVDMAGPPAPGARLMITRISMDPSRVDDNIEFFKREIVPRIKSAPGYRALRNMINPQTGEGIVGSMWADEQSMQAASEMAMARRPEAIERGVTFGETSYREVIFADMP